VTNTGSDRFYITGSSLPSSLGSAYWILHWPTWNRAQSFYPASLTSVCKLSALTAWYLQVPPPPFQVFRLNFLCIFQLSHVCYMPGHLTLLDLMTQIILGSENSPLYTFPRSWCLHLQSTANQRIIGYSYDNSANKLMLSLLFHNFCNYNFHFYATAAYRNGNPTCNLLHSHQRKDEANIFVYRARTHRSKTAVFTSNYRVWCTALYWMPYIMNSCRQIHIMWCSCCYHKWNWRAMTWEQLPATHIVPQLNLNFAWKKISFFIVSPCIFHLQSANVSN
jgi:hypothetical protein